MNQRQIIFPIIIMIIVIIFIFHLIGKNPIVKPNDDNYNYDNGLTTPPPSGLTFKF